ncbi:CaiB/BaiF CoA transferase family protein [Amycolatopsis thermophila]|uniref:Formyl-CoA transferase n=1 Tax=Amycolatopsis thermophila TaxID=206084 RepID=A0ABU0F103_9PSEU|nr:CoA transferase [Amycolatopsis thermophila]MDQ0381191.1 formyl-CoA transferase [Amycolatopsis thermophila]
MTDAFEGIRILDFTQLEQGPSATQVLADFGAEVIKVERIDAGEIGRFQPPLLANGFSPHWSATNRNKKSISIDVKSPEGREIIHTLAQDADIVASNFRPGVMDRLGFGWEQLSAINPRIIVAYASGYGLSGPYAHRRGQDLAAQAISGLMALTGSKETGPVPTGTFMIDYLASMQFAQGMMIALAAREKTGRGQVVDSNLLNAAITSHLQEGTTYLNTGQRFDRPAAGIAHAHNTALYGYYEAADGLWFTLIGEFYVDRQWQRAARACGLDQDVADDPRFQTIDGLREHTEETHRLLAEAIRKFPRAEIMARFEAEDVLVAPVHDYDAVFDDPQVRHNGLVLEAEVDGVGPVKFVGMPVALTETPARLRHLPPTIGRHNDEVLTAAGLSPQRIAELKAAGVVGSERDRERDGGTPAWS